MQPIHPLLAPLRSTIWRAASGRRLRHTVYSLIGCPAVKAATYLLVARAYDGSHRVLAVRRTRTGIPSLNLAAIRRTGARLGANEVHLYLAARSDIERARIVDDLLRSPTAAMRAAPSKPGRRHRPRD